MHVYHRKLCLSLSKACTISRLFSQFIPSLILFCFYFFSFYKNLCCVNFMQLHYKKNHQKMWKMATRWTRSSYQHNPHVIYWQISGLMLFRISVVMCSTASTKKKYIQYKKIIQYHVACRNENKQCLSQKQNKNGKVCHKVFHLNSGLEK